MPSPKPRALLVAVGPPMLATAASDARDLDDGLRFERKYDGFRAIGAVSGGEAALMSRSGGELGARFPSVLGDLASLRTTAVLDGEVVGEGVTGSTFEGLGGGGAVRFTAFDLLWEDDVDLRPRPLFERRRRLERLLAGQQRIALAERVDGPLDRALAAARARRWEGLVAKRPDAPYVAGRQQTWRKVRLVAAQDVVVVGWRPLAGDATAMGALLVAVAVPGGLRYAGRVGTGFSEAERRVWSEALEPHVVAAPRVTRAPREAGNLWVEPLFVVEVHLREWTREGLLRQPSFVRVRPDKTPPECSVEAEPFTFAPSLRR